jgi:protease II
MYCVRALSKIFLDDTPVPAIATTVPAIATSRPRRRHSPEPRMVANTNNRDPQVVEINTVEQENVSQRAQFATPSNDVWDICWDRQKQTVVILSSNTPHRLIDCNGANRSGQQLTLKDVLELLNYNPENYHLENIWVEYNMLTDALLNTTIEHLPLCQFNVAP